MKHVRYSRGIGVIEIVVVAGIISTVFLSISQLLVLATRPIAAGAREAQAMFLAEEAIEAVRTLRNVDWTDNIASLTNDTPYYPLLAGDNWSLTTSNPGVIDNTYTRTVVVSAVYRDGDDNISTSSGTLDEKTRKVTATVSWSERGQSKSVVLETYITNFLGS